MRLAFVLALLPLVGGCASWAPVSPQSLTNYAEPRGQRVFVVTPKEAYEMDLVASDDKTLNGDVVHAWLVTQDAPVYVDDDPDAMVERLHWVPLHRIPEEVYIPVSSVTHVRKKSWARNTVPIVVVVGTVLLAGIAMAAIEFAESPPLFSE